MVVTQTTPGKSGREWRATVSAGGALGARVHGVEEWGNVAVIIEDGTGDKSPYWTSPGGHPHEPPRRLRVLFANDPLSYRQSMANAIKMLRPNIEVFVGEPEELDLEVERTSPDVVVCSHVTPLVEKGVSFWIDLYPDGERLAVVCVEGRRSERAGIDLEGMLSVIDRATRARNFRPLGRSQC